MPSKSNNKMQAKAFSFTVVSKLKSGMRNTMKLSDKHKTNYESNAIWPWTTSKREL